MPSAHTVLGEVPVEKLGVTFPHEHVVLAWGAARSDLGPAYNVEAIVSAVSADLGPAVKNHKLGTIVDAGPPELGRDVDVQRLVSRALGVNIIAATGAYKMGGGACPWSGRCRTWSSLSSTLLTRSRRALGPTR